MFKGFIIKATIFKILLWIAVMNNTKVVEPINNLISAEAKNVIVFSEFSTGEVSGACYWIVLLIQYFLSMIVFFCAF